MIVVLGIDALEYNLVEGYKLNALKQNNYTDTSLEEFKILNSNLIWASILIGRKDENLENKLISSDSKVLPPLKKKISKFLPPDIKAKLKDFLNLSDEEKIENSAMNKTKNWVQEKNMDSIFDLAENPWHVPIPGFDGNPGHVNRVRLLNKALRGKTRAASFYENLVWKDYKIRKGALFGALKQSHDLLFFYTNLLDALGHLFHKNKKKRLSWYMEINNLVDKAKKQVGDGDKLYTVSDHGMKIKHRYGDHTNHGFFSSNTGELIKRPTELYSLLEDSL